MSKSLIKSNETLNEVINLNLGGDDHTPTTVTTSTSSISSSNSSPFEGLQQQRQGSDSSGQIERVTPLEEFNTLYRNKDMVRASIKLKESNLI